jgi:hypothetical protein
MTHTAILLCPLVTKCHRQHDPKDLLHACHSALCVSFRYVCVIPLHACHSAMCVSFRYVCVIPLCVCHSAMCVSFRFVRVIPLCVCHSAMSVSFHCSISSFICSCVVTIYPLTARYNMECSNKSFSMFICCSLSLFISSHSPYFST